MPAQLGLEEVDRETLLHDCPARANQITERGVIELGRQIDGLAKRKVRLLMPALAKINRAAKEESGRMTGIQLGDLIEFTQGVLAPAKGQQRTRPGAAQADVARAHFEQPLQNRPGGMRGDVSQVLVKKVLQIEVVRIGLASLFEVLDGGVAALRLSKQAGEGLVGIHGQRFAIEDLPP